MEAREQLEVSYLSDHELRLTYYSESFTESAYTSSNSDSDGDNIAEPRVRSGASSTPPVESNN